MPLHHFKLEPLVVFRHEKTPKGQIYVQLLGFSSRRPFFSLRRLVRGGATGPREARANAHMFG
ncbi:hypothetical protein [Burkholderia pseudomallei]|uniref:hypothetical protein n=1 Tax=Burkholderia pseudomallei TaxID=28450 RepID=UPI001F2DDD14|nr:hypothetical protein [Burkholderia pseudomallei]